MYLREMLTIKLFVSENMLDACFDFREFSLWIILPYCNYYTYININADIDMYFSQWTQNSFSRIEEIFLRFILNES